MEKRLRIVSFNIENRLGEPIGTRNSRLRHCAAFLKSLEPDLVALQEVEPTAWQCLRDELAVDEAVFTPRADGECTGEGVPVFRLNPDLAVLDHHSFWFSETPDIPSRSWRAAHPRVCSALRVGDGAAQPLWLFNLHLDHRSRQARVRSLDVLRDHLRELTAPDDRIIICGDFNMPGYRKSLRNFLHGEPKLRDATQHHPIGALRPTYLGWGPLRLARARIDLCLHSQNLRVKSYHAVNPEWQGRWISDHRALVVEFATESRSD